MKRRRDEDDGEGNGVVRQPDESEPTEASKSESVPVTEGEREANGSGKDGEPRESAAGEGEEKAEVKKSSKQGEEEGEDEDEGTTKYAKRGGGTLLRRDCPYLDTINRAMLDFDFEKFCYVSLSNLNVYGCLVCGKYYQGRGRSSHAYTHALECGHHVFINLATEKVYCLPDGYEVDDPALEDIRQVLHPRFKPDQLGAIERNKLWSRGLDGTEYLPGMIGLNNLSLTDHVNVIIQALQRVRELRNFFLIESNYAKIRSPLVQAFGELCRKIWNPSNYKGQVSPHEFMQAVAVASNKRYKIGQAADPVEFLSWFLNELHVELGGKKKARSSIIYQCFQGELEVITGPPSSAGMSASEGKADGEDTHMEAAPNESVKKVPFLMLGLDLPPPPLFQDVMEKNIIPQVPLFTILKKFDGVTETETIREGRRRFRITRLPKYLCLYMKRFTKNNFFVEKNPTIVNFPVKNLELKDVIPLPKKKDGSPVASKYDLVANIVHEGRPKEGVYRVHAHHKPEDIWYEIQDLLVQETLPQVVALSEAYIQIYELKSTQ